MNRLAMEEKRQNVIVEKTEHFADRIIKMYSYLLNERRCNNQIVELKQVKETGQALEQIPPKANTHKPRPIF